MSNPFSDDFKTTPDYSWLTDIEKIQAEITRDLERAQSLSAMPESETNEYTLSEETDASNPWLIPRPEAPAVISGTYANTLSPKPAAGFYRETIKGTHQRHRSWAKTVAVILLICTLGMGSLGFGLGSAFFWAREQTVGISSEQTGDNPNIPTITSNQYVFDTGSNLQAGTVADMVQMLEPAVVSVTSRFELNNRAAMPGEGTISGSGTIFAENEDRIFIVTGDYVTRGAAQIFVRISGSQPLLARSVDGNMRTGLAVISLYKQQLLDAGIDSVVIAAFGNSDDMLVGDTVFAIGNARNEGNSVTRGIISAGKQEISFPGYTLTVLQTDAAINYGNSGGPLINTNGEIIGINIDRAGVQFGQAQVEGIGYSIASNVALPILMAFIDPERPAIGIVGQTLTEEVALYRNLDINIPAIGVLVHSVAPGGAADLAGILPDDVITSFAGEPVFLMEELVQLISQHRIGDVVEVRVMRGSASVTLELELLAFIR